MDITHDEVVSAVTELKQRLIATYESFPEFKKGYVSAGLWCEVKAIPPWQLREDVLFNGMKIDSAEFRAGVLKFCNDQIEARNVH